MTGGRQEVRGQSEYANEAFTKKIKKNMHYKVSHTRMLVKHILQSFHKQYTCIVQAVHFEQTGVMTFN